MLILKEFHTALFASELLISCHVMFNAAVCECKLSDSNLIIYDIRLKWWIKLLPSKRKKCVCNRSAHALYWLFTKCKKLVCF